MTWTVHWIEVMRDMHIRLHINRLITDCTPDFAHILERANVGRVQGDELLMHFYPIGYDPNYIT